MSFLRYMYVRPFSRLGSFGAIAAALAGISNRNGFPVGRLSAGRGANVCWRGELVVKKYVSILVLLLGAAGSFSATASDNGQLTSIHSAELNSLGQQPSDEFGDAVAIDGDTVVVGAAGAEVNGNPTGAAYVFVKPATGWTNMTQTATLIPSDQAGLFGASVAVSGDTVVIGAPWTTVNGDLQEGAVYVYVKPAGGWTNMTETAKLTGFHIDGIGEDHVGATVAINGNTIVAGVPNVIPDFRALGQGEAFVYVEPPGGWTNTTETAALYNQVGALGFGVSVSISGSTIAVGADGCCSQGQTQVGVAFVFVEPADGWTTTSNFNAALTGIGVGADDGFGYAVAVAGDTVVVGSPQLWDYEVGAAYVYVEPPGGWIDMVQTAELYPLFTVQGDFGQSVAISGKVVFIGAPFTWLQHGAQGAAYGFVEPKTGWRSTSDYRAMLSTPNGYGYSFGQSVSISGTTAVVGFSGTSDTNGGAIVWTAQ
jgi:hypothetical protein